MKRTIFISIFVLIGAMAHGQSYSDFFTTYKDVSNQSQKSVRRQNKGVTQFEIIDVDNFYQRINPQNVQILNGIYLHGGLFYSVKLKIGFVQNQIVVCGYWDGNMWNNSRNYVSTIGDYGVPDQIKRACTYQTYIQPLGTVYF